MMVGVVKADMQGHFREGMPFVPSFDPCLARAVVRYLAECQEIQAVMEFVKLFMRFRQVEQNRSPGQGFHVNFCASAQIL